MNIIKSTHDWFVTAGQANVDGTPNFRQIAFYLGMQVEELNEKLALVLGKDSQLVAYIENLATGLKNGSLDAQVENAVRANPKDWLDGDLDVIWVTIGSLAASGANGEGGYAHVGERNWAKFPGGVVTRHPQTGKVIKPEGWTPPDLTPFVHPSLLNPPTADDLNGM